MKLKLLATLSALSLLLLNAEVYAITNNKLSNGNPSMNISQTIEENKKAGESYLTANKTKPGVKTLPDGLQYKVIKPGSGEKPTANDVVTVEYEGKLINGKIFDSSAAHGGTASFPVGQVIAGWTEVLQLMPVGSTWEVYIPSELAYGDQGAPPTIGPGETLIFKIKLMEIKK